MNSRVAADDGIPEAYNSDPLVAAAERAMAMVEFTVEQFEGARRENGTCYWDAHEFMAALGYETWQSFQGVITRAMGSCAALNIDPTEAFISETVPAEDGKLRKTYRLTRFACFLIAMQADSKKPQAAKVKAVLAAILETLVADKVGQDALGRIETRNDLSLAEKVMTGVAKNAGLEGDGFAIFKDAGFRGMYNMSLADLKKHKGVVEKGTVLYDFMGLEELAGNLFRVTQIAARIKSHELRGLTPLSHTATKVGAEVRDMMIRNSGVRPESLPIEQDITKVKSRLRTAARKMKRLDEKK